MTLELNNLNINQAAHYAETKRPALMLSKGSISLFCIFFILSAQLIAFSHFPELKMTLRPLARPIGVGLGIEQMWLMFSPDVRRTNYHSNAVFTFADGTLRLYEFPRMDKRNQLDRFYKFKLQKLFNDVMANPVGKPYRPAIAEYLINCFESPSNPVEMVSLIFNYTNTPKITQDTQNQLGSRSHLPDHYTKSNYFEYYRKK